MQVVLSVEEGTLTWGISKGFHRFPEISHKPGIVSQYTLIIQSRFSDNTQIQQSRHC